MSTVGVRRTKNHQYYFGDQGPWPGVTTVCDVLDKPALTRWHREQVAQAAVAHADRLVADAASGNVGAAVAFLLNVRTEGTNSRERGTRVHAALESIVRREPYDLDPRDEPAVAGARTWLNERHVQPIEVEAFLINETAGYGGTCDLIAEIDGETHLLDWKTSKSVANAKGEVWAEMRLQLAAYAHAQFVAKIGDPERYPMPRVERYGVVHVTDAGTRLYPVEITEADWTAFRAALFLYGWRGGKAA